MKTTHTPGPWHVEKHNLHNLIVAEDKTYPQLRTVIAELPASTEEEANARLIASAPELLELANRIEWFATAGTERNGVPYMITNGDWLRLWEQARAAIAKATEVKGES